MTETAQKQKKKRTPLIALVVLVMLVLCGLGFVFPRGRVLPVISLAAERIPISLPLPGFQDGIPNTLPTAILTSLLLIILALIYNLSARRAEKTGRPNRFLVAVDALFEGLYSFVENIAKDKTRALLPLVATFFFFILTANWMGLLPGVGSIGLYAEHHGERVLVPFFRGANADLSTTLALAIISVITVQVVGFRYQGPHYLRKFFNFSAPPGSGALSPVLRIANGFAGLLEIISEVSKIFSFAFRLFGNIFAGEVLLIVVSFLAAFVATLPFMGLELFVGLVQALVFSMLSLVFYTMATHHH